MLISSPFPRSIKRPDNAHIPIATIDPKRWELDGWSLFCIVGMQQVSLMWRQFADGYLDTGSGPIGAVHL